MLAKSFHISDIVSVATVYLFFLARNWADIYEILCFMCGYEVFTHQILRLIQVYRPYLLEQYDFLVPLSIELQSRTIITSKPELLEELIQKLGTKELLVNPLPKDVDTWKNPINERLETKYREAKLGEICGELKYSRLPKLKIEVLMRQKQNLLKLYKLNN